MRNDGLSESLSLDMDTNFGLLSEDLIQAVEALAEVFNARAIRYALIGELATAMHGYCLFHRSVEFLLDVPQIALPGLLDTLAERGFTIDQPAIIKQYVREHVASFRFGQVRIDWLKPVLPLYSHALAGAQTLKWSEGHPIQVVKAEGLILTKMVAFRIRDQLDIDILLTANRDTIDINLIREEWAPFAATEPERTTWLEAAIEKRVVRRE